MVVFDLSVKSKLAMVNYSYSFAMSVLNWLCYKISETFFYSVSLHNMKILMLLLLPELQNLLWYSPKTKTLIKSLNLS